MAEGCGWPSPIQSDPPIYILHYKRLHLVDLILPPVFFKQSSEKLFDTPPLIITVDF